MRRRTERHSASLFENLEILLAISVGVTISALIVVVLNVVEIGLAMSGVTLPWR